MLTSSPSSAARTALIYITLGTLLVIWTAVWYIFMQNNPPASHGPFYVCSGLAVTGVALIAIGLAVGRIGSSARQAEIPPEAVVTAPLATDAAGNPVGAAAPAGTTAPVVPMPAVVPPVKTIAPVASAPVTEKYLNSPVAARR